MWIRSLLAGTTILASVSPLSATAQSIIELEPIIVQAESNTTLIQDGYVAESGRQATKVDTPILQIPQAITTVTQAQLEDQKPRTLNEALGYTASANPNNYGFDTRYDAFFLRGFPAYYTGIFRDGLRQYNGPSAWFRNDPYTTEGVAILKGPASSLYGVSGPGGLVNIVSKRPTEHRYREIELLGGTDDRKQLAFDFSGPADDAGVLSYRLTALARDSGTTLPGYRDDKLLFAPALSWNISDRTRLTVLGEYSDATVGGTAAFYNPSYGVASRLYEGDPAYNDFSQQQARLGYELEHEVNDALVLRQHLRFADVDADLEYSGHYPDGAGGLARYWGHYAETMKVFTVDNMAQFTFSTGAASHELVAGLDFTRAEYDAHSVVGYVSAPATAAMDLPYYGGQRSNQTGLYLHDQIALGAWTVFASGRYDWVETTAIAADGTRTRTDDDAFSGRIGLSYQMANGLVPYANLSTSFSPNIGVVYDDVTSNDSRPAEPTRALQKEVGLKYQLPGTNSLVSAALFEIEQKDGIVFDTSTGMNRQRQLDLTSRGIELEAVANFDHGLSVIASYTHLKVRIDQGATGTAGNELSATPNDVAALWVQYDADQGALSGLGLGAGLRYVGRSWGDDTNTFRNSDRMFVDLAASYDFAAQGLRGLKLQANVKNLFDQSEQMCTAGYCYFDEGRTATLSIGRRF
ncbi:TonB-dependent siderophore receptor [Plastorhodobacter daqingensis]|uniref:TonB-dependent siderophore receptor n=1 Tax=Plastorhodobacter daqingensis TaxID=1387281 RepID=A0ABW2UIJ2_9RHOB